VERTRYDLTARRVARLDAVAFFCWLLTAFAQHLRWATWLDTRTTPEAPDPEVTGDLVAHLESVSVAAPPWMFPVEFQTVPDPGMFGRLQKQIGEWWSDLRPDELPDSRFQVCCAVVNLTGTRQRAPASREYRFPTDGLTWGGQVRERFLAEESADAALKRVEDEELGKGILPLIVLMHGAGDPGIIKRWVLVAGAETDPRRRADLGSLALTLASLKDWFPAWKEALKRWNMQESPFVLDLQLQTKLEAVKAVLEARFGEVPPDLTQQLATVTDLDRADQLVRAAARAKQLEDFQV
jgi:hypothetical protein